MNDQLSNLSSVLHGDAGLLSAALAWIGLARFVLKLFNTWLESFFTGMLNATTGNDKLKDLANRVMSSFWYQILHYTVNWITSVSLPKIENLKLNETSSSGSNSGK